jgi:deoxyribose-phosphate aldolase
VRKHATDLEPRPAAPSATLRAAIEHTLLAADATPARVERLCDEALAQRFHGVCVNPSHVARCRARLVSSAVRVITVIGFPLGAQLESIKAREAELAVRDGADELDMVMQIGLAKAGDWAAVEADARAVVAAAAGKPVKLIIETGLLDASEKARACAVALGAGAAFVKTCSGFAPGGATPEDVALLAAHSRGQIAIKASGGIRSAAAALELLGAGATRLGTSAGVQIIAELDRELR